MNRVLPVILSPVGGMASQRVQLSQLCHGFMNGDSRESSVPLANRMAGTNDDCHSGSERPKQDAVWRS